MLERLGAQAPSPRGQLEELNDPAYAPGLEALYAMFRESPDTKQRGYILPARIDKEGTPHLAMPGFLMEMGRGAVDLLAGPETGVMTPEATGAMMDLATSSAFSAPQPGLLAAIRAYHGSPHTFDRFSMDRIGTGEGAQAYGHGLYYAESPSVAESYKTAGQFNSDVRPVVGGKDLSEFEPGSVQDQAARAVKHRLLTHNGVGPVDWDSLSRGWRRTAETTGQPELTQVADTIDEWAKQGIENRPGNLYEVSLAPDHEDLLDWDAPLSQQSEKVRAALATKGYEAGLAADPAKIAKLQAKVDEIQGYMDRASRPEQFESQMRRAQSALQKARGLTGREVYQQMATQGGEYADAAASRALREAGIPGIRYLDAGSRGAGEGSRNVVMFDDALVEILSRNGQPVSR